MAYLFHAKFFLPQMEMSQRKVTLVLKIRFHFIFSE